MVPHIITNKGLQVVLGGETFAVAPTVPNYVEILNQIYLDANESKIRDMIEATRKRVEAAVKLSISLSYNGGCVYHHGQKLMGYAVKKLVALIEAGKDVTALANFLTKIQANPNQAVIENLYEFLEFGQMPITMNGNFVAYKAVRSDWRDIHSGSVLNTIGSYISMPRLAVDADRNRTCSNGYHVCSYSYLPHFANAGGRILACEVNPADVVAIPADYNNTKMRVSSYRVIEEVTTHYDAGVNILSQNEVWEERYTLSGRIDEHAYSWEVVGVYDDFEEAVDEAEFQLDCSGGDYSEVQIVNSKNTLVYYKKG